MCGFGISGSETLSLSIRVGEMDLRKTGKWKWTRTVCLGLVIIELQVLLPKSYLLSYNQTSSGLCLFGFVVLELGSCHLRVG